MNLSYSAHVEFAVLDQSFKDLQQTSLRPVIKAKNRLNPYLKREMLCCTYAGAVLILCYGYAGAA
jgi:hypothetical protein